MLYISFAVRLLESMLSVLLYLFVSNCLCGKLGSLSSIFVQKLDSISSFLSLNLKHVFSKIGHFESIFLIRQKLSDFNLVNEFGRFGV